MGNRIHYVMFAMILSFAVVSVTLPLSVDAMVGKGIIEFSNIGQYIAFENKMKNQLGMPIVPINFETGQLEPGKQLTTDYTNPGFHTDRTNPTIFVDIDKHADIEGFTVYTKEQAQSRGLNQGN